MKPPYPPLRYYAGRRGSSTLHPRILNGSGLSGSYGTAQTRPISPESDSETSAFRSQLPHVAVSARRSRDHKDSVPVSRGTSTREFPISAECDVVCSFIPVTIALIIFQIYSPVQDQVKRLRAPFTKSLLTDDNSFPVTGDIEEVARTGRS